MPVESSKPLGGFTLIELLIVVAIISILAAIAIPNMLDAQTRSKVARAKDDQRTLATAVEAYRVDWNWAPLGQMEWALAVDPPYKGTPTEKDHGGVMYSPFTTPVAYLTSIPRDPFLTGDGDVTYGDEHKPTHGLHQYDSLVWSTGKYSTWTHFDWRVLARSGHNFLFQCYGPWCDRGWLYLPKPPSPTAHGGPLYCMFYGIRLNLTDGIYDPTNGTPSKGFICRTAKGPVAVWR